MPAAPSLSIVDISDPQPYALTVRIDSERQAVLDADGDGGLGWIADVFSDARIEAHFERHGFGLWAVEVPGVADFVGVIGGAFVCIKIFHVEEHHPAVVLHHDRGAGTAVVRIGGIANAAVTPPRWDTHRGAASEHGEGGLHA